ncbi:uncharacterized protein TNCV_4965281 [Trichonephila clavipes]|nr:uncharacterized protein TNCV_4965281 [Trichonephila clavipes]
MDVFKCIVPSQHGGTLNSRRDASPLVRLVEGDERSNAPDYPQGFMELPEDSDMFETLDSADMNPVRDESFLNTFFRKLKRVRDLDLSRLRRSRTCQFYCEPAIENRDSGVGGSLHDAEPLVRVMINHCLRCLRRKGFMHKIMQRRLQKREALATPNNQVTLPSTLHKKFSRTNTPLPYHNFFGGWISFNEKQNQYSNVMNKPLKMRGFRKLLFKVKKEEIVVKERFDEDYTSFSQNLLYWLQNQHHYYLQRMLLLRSESVIRKVRHKWHTGYFGISGKHVKSIQVLPKVVGEILISDKLYKSLSKKTGNKRSCEALTLKSPTIIIGVIRSGL